MICYAVVALIFDGRKRKMHNRPMQSYSDSVSIDGKVTFDKYNRAGNTITRTQMQDASSTTSLDTFEEDSTFLNRFSNISNQTDPKDSSLLARDSRLKSLRFVLGLDCLLSA